MGGVDSARCDRRFSTPKYSLRSVLCCRNAVDGYRNIGAYPRCEARYGDGEVWFGGEFLHEDYIVICWRGTTVEAVHHLGR